eukprot:1157218-Pelagomonas_calceolata.AAC.3
MLYAHNCHTQALQKSPNPADRTKGAWDVAADLYNQGGIGTFWQNEINEAWERSIASPALPVCSQVHLMGVPSKASDWP